MPNYIQDPNDSTKQVPGAQPPNAFTRTLQPEAFSGSYKAPNYILFNTAMQDPFGLFFGSSASYAEAATNDSGPAGYTSSLVGAGNYQTFPAAIGTAGTRLDFNPTVVSSSARDAGQVTFVYKGGLDGQGRL